MTTDIPALDALSLVTILNSLDALVYVSDMETHEMVFMNRYGERRWGIWQSRRCYEVLQESQGGPCAFCNKPLLFDADGGPTGVHVWEFQNTVTGRWFQCRDEAIPWVDGRLVRLEIAVDITERKQLEDALKSAQAAAEKLALIDPLTELKNRRAFFDEAEGVLKRARRHRHPLGVAMVDVDHFKQVNDIHGHFAGDEVLRQVAHTIVANLREVDVIARVGGEEFGILLPATDLDAARVICERVRMAVQQLAVSVDGVALNVSCSIGVVASAVGAEDIDTLLAAADRALYRAKAGGRNQVA